MSPKNIKKPLVTLSVGIQIQYRLKWFKFLLKLKVKPSILVNLGINKDKSKRLNRHSSTTILVIVFWNFYKVLVEV